MSRRFFSYFVIASLLFGCASSLFAQSRAEKAQAEWQRLDEMNKSISAPEYVGREAEADLATVSSLAKHRAHIDALAKEFEKEIKEDNQPFRNLGIAIRFMRERLAGFEKAAKEYGSAEAIKGDLEHVMRMAKMGVENKSPAFFLPENDIAIRAASARARLRFLEALEPGSKAAKEVAKAIGDSAKEVSTLQASLAKEIVAQNEPPQDGYQGADRNALIKLLIETWAKSGVKVKVIKVGIIGPDWKRGVSWQWQNDVLYKFDRSRIQGFLLVEYDAKTVARHSVNFVKDHLSKDAVTAGFLEDPKEKPGLTDLISKEKVK